ncbi:hypothetical protein JCM11251_003853 [Rhodosporidiobolus azoricus]
MSRSPSPPESASSLATHDQLQPPSGRSTGIVLLSPRQSPTPEAAAALPAGERSATPTPLQAAEPNAEVDEGRALVRGITRGEALRTPDALYGAYYDADGFLLPGPPSPNTAEEPDAPYRASSSRLVVDLNELGPSNAGEYALRGEGEEEEDQEALFSSSLDAGEEALLRRRSRLRRRVLADSVDEADDAATEGLGGMDLLTEDTGWVFIPPGPSAGAYEPETSPEEERARRMAAATEGRWDDSAWAAEEEELRRVERELVERREEQSSGLWRNDPLSVPRTSALPRGGRFYPAAAPSRSASTSTFSPSNPPASQTSSFPTPASRIVSTSITWTNRPDLLPPDIRERYDREHGSALDPALSDSSQSSLMDAANWTGQNFVGPPRSRTPPPVAAHRSPPASLSIFHSPPRPRATASGRPSSISNFTSTFTSSVLNNPISASSPPRRRTREETNALMGHALRAKKGVYLLYCGGEEGERGVGEGEVGEALPPGFSYAAGGGEASEGRSAFRRGCGALLCARALLSGVPSKVFSDEDARRGLECAAASSDLPPSAARVTDWDATGKGEGDAVERVGKRGWKGCKGCITRDVGCKRCGNHLGYRLLRPCVTCSIARPSYTSYANVVSHSTSSAASSSVSSLADPPRSPGGTTLTMTAGGVTGGGVVDGLLFHFRLNAVTALERLVGVQPEEELDGEKRARKVAGKKKQLERDEGEEKAERDLASPGRRGAGPGRRLVEETPGMGEATIWRNVPSAQRDFLDDLLGEPSDWITPSGETWWLDNAVAKHTQRGGGYGYGSGAGGRGRKRRAEEGAFGIDGRSSDRLSTATTTVDSSTGASSLSRSGAIRHRIPLATSSSPSGAATNIAPTPFTYFHPEAVDEYDRFRADASDFTRRVRQRLADPSASVDAGGGGIVRGLERAGYGSGFEAEEGDGDGQEEPQREGLRRRRTGRERTRRRTESVGR